VDVKFTRQTKKRQVVFSNIFGKREKERHERKVTSLYYLISTQHICSSSSSSTN